MPVAFLHSISNVDAIVLKWLARFNIIDIVHVFDGHKDFIKKVQVFSKMLPAIL